MRGIERIPGVEYAALVPNIRGAERALDCGVDELNLVMSASETHNAANLRMTPAQSLAQFAEIVRLVDGRKQVNASLSTARSEERRVGKECVSTCRSRWSPYN